MRYKDQGFELDVPWPSAQVTDSVLSQVQRSFHARHERMYGFALEDLPVELVNLRVDALGVLPQPRMRELPEMGPASRAVVGEQSLYIESARVQVPVYDRAKLGAGAVVEGPAIVTQLDSTTLLLPRQQATVHPQASLVVSDREKVNSSAQPMRAGARTLESGAA